MVRCVYKTLAAEREMDNLKEGILKGGQRRVRMMDYKWILKEGHVGMKGKEDGRIEERTQPQTDE